MFDVQEKSVQLKHAVYNDYVSKRNWLAEQLALQNGRFLYWCPVFLAVGIGGYFLLPVEPPVIIPIFAVLLSLCCLAFSGFKNQSRVKLILSLAVLPAMGFLCAKVNIMRVHTPIIAEKIGPVMIQGTIQRIELTKADYDARILFSDVVIEDLEADQTPNRIRLRLRSDYNLEVGQRISALAEVMPPSEPLLPGGFNFRRHMYFQGIGAVGFIYNKVEILQGASSSTFRNAVETARSDITSKVHDVLPRERAGVATALMNGMRAGIVDEDREALRNAGLAHLLAISGLHVGMVCGAIFFFLRFAMASLGNFALRHPIKKYAALMALIAGVAYMFLAGATVPTQRAILMTGVVLIAITLDRSPISLRLVACAALVVLMFSPSSLLSASFQLSFAAVTALVAFYEWIRPALTQWRRNMNGIQKFAFYFIGIAMTSVIAGLATAPFSLYHFQQFAGYGGIIANMIAIPLMAFWVMPSAILSMLSMPFGLEKLPLIIMGQGVENVMEAARFGAALEGSVIKLPLFSFLSFLGIACGLLFFILWQGVLRYAGLIVFAISIFFIFQSNQPIALVSSTNKLLALNSYDGYLSVNTLRREKFVRENWERALAFEKDSSETLKNSQIANCDDVGCHVVVEGKKVAYSLSPYTHNYDCAWADIVISKDPVRQKCKAKVIDFFDTYYDGAHAIYLNDNNIEIKSVGEMLYSKRPWNTTSEN